MSHNQITDENLNALIDGQLATDERMRVFDSLKEDHSLSNTLCELQRNDEFLSLAYSNTPEPAYNPFIAATRISARKQLILAASFIFMISSMAGWQLHHLYTYDNAPQIQDISQLNIGQLSNHKVLMHISTMDTARIENAFTKAEKILTEMNNADDLQVEIVANADGLGLLRDSSPYAARIKSLSQNHKNLSFKACGIAMQAAKLKEGKEIHLLLEAQKVPAALEQILNRLKLGWLYIKV